MTRETDVISNRFISYLYLMTPRFLPYTCIRFAHSAEVWARAYGYFSRRPRYSAGQKRRGSLDTLARRLSWLTSKFASLRWSLRALGPRAGFF